MDSCKTPDSKIHLDETPEVSGSVDISSAILSVTPVCLAKYILHQMYVCRQNEVVLVESFRRYFTQLQLGSTTSSQTLTAGDIWSGLLWWRDEQSWVGTSGILSYAEVCRLAELGLQEYFSMYDSGMSQDEIVCSSLKKHTTRLSQKLSERIISNPGAPGFRALITYAVSELPDTMTSNEV